MAWRRSRRRCACVAKRACVYLELELLAGGLVVLAADRRGEERDERDDGKGEELHGRSLRTGVAKGE